MSLSNSNLERHYRLGPPLPLPRPRPLPLPRPRPLPATASLFLDFTFGSTSTSSVSRGKLSGRIKYRMLFPRILSVSSCTGSRFFRVIFTALRCVFMLTSTPVIVPWTCVPFFNSMVTVSWLNFIKNLTSFILAAPSRSRSEACTKPNNEGPTDWSMNGRKRLLLDLRRKGRAELCECAAETLRPRRVARPSAREGRHGGPWRLEVYLAPAEGV